MFFSKLLFSEVNVDLNLGALVPNFQMSPSLVSTCGCLLGTGSRATFTEALALPPSPVIAGQRHWLFLVFLQGIQFLIENDLLKNTCEDIAQFLYKGEGLNKTAIGDYLGER